jgi:photosystem II stability/assembly factor-like uncharacterized protein
MQRHGLLLAILLVAVGAARAQWQMEDSHTTADLRGIDNVGAGVAWASGTNGTVLRTEDGGYLWQACSVPPGAEHLDFRGVQAFDANTAIVMSSGKGDLSRLYKTTDGCQTWKLVFTNPDKDGFWDAVQFDKGPDGAGIVLGDPVNGKFPIFRASDSGSIWARWGGFNQAEDDQERQAKARASETLFAASNQALAFWGEGAFAFATGSGHEARFIYSDYGSEWCIEFGGNCAVNFHSITLPALASGLAAGAFAVAPKDYRTYWPLRLMIVGGDFKRPDEGRGTAVFVSSRDGVHVPFTSYFDFVRPSTPPHGYRSAVAYDAAPKTWITVGPNGTDISTDDGKNWRAVHPDPAQHEAPDADRDWNALSLPFVVGPHGRIGKLGPKALDGPKNGK